MIDNDYKVSVLTTIEKSGIPVGFWKDVRTFFKQSYDDVFSSISSDPNLVENQRIQKIHQDRHFRNENTLEVLAKKHDISYSATILSENKFNSYVYVAKGSVGFTQSYVKRIGDLPNPAAYWKKLAEKTGLPRLDLGDEPPDVQNIKDVYGLLTHNPVGSEFTAESQKLGMIQFCVPSCDGKSWNLELTIQEIISSYKEESTENIAQPVVKPRLKKGVIK